jgi:hypothetical protein
VEEGAADEGVPGAERSLIRRRLQPLPRLQAPTSTILPIQGHVHWVHEDKAGKCVAPCSLGNRDARDTLTPLSLALWFLIDNSTSYSIFPHQS